jgi:hypothetical protein
MFLGKIWNNIGGKTNEFRRNELNDTVNCYDMKMRAHN